MLAALRILAYFLPLLPHGVSLFFLSRLLLGVISLLSYFFFISLS